MKEKNITFIISVLLIVVLGAYFFETVSQQLSLGTRQKIPFTKVSSIPNPYSITQQNTTNTDQLRTSPPYTVENFYNWYMVCIQDGNCRFLEYPNLDRTIAQKISNNPTFYPFITCSQTLPNSVTVDPQSAIIDDRAAVVVTEHFGPTLTTKILVSLRGQDGSWYITNFVCYR